MVGNTSENTYSDDSLLSRLDQALAKVEDAFSFFAAIVILGLMLFGTLNAIFRKGPKVLSSIFEYYNIPIEIYSFPIWGYTDLVQLFMVAFAFLAISAMQRVGGHIRMELFVRRMKGRTLWLSEFVGVLVALFIITVLFFYSSTAFLRAFELGDTTIAEEIATWPSKIWVPIAFTVLIARLILQIWGYGRLIVHPGATPIAVPLMHSETEIADKEIQDTFGDDQIDESLLKE
jgi:TRAP-type C4-dicarboxylate transport system permease small subunit